MIALQLNQFRGKNLVGIEQENIKDQNKDDLIIEGDSRSLSNAEAQELKNWLKTTLSSKVKNVKITNKLDTHPCIITAENMSFLRHLIKTNYLQREKVNDFFNVVNITLEINPKNGLIKSLYSIHGKDPELGKAIAEQVILLFFFVGISIGNFLFIDFFLLKLFDNCLVTAGLIEDPRLVLSNLNKLLEKAFVAK